ncbi:aldolase [Dacryopinax primogenitus]|uniref:Fructose-bisphosphate aldolase n=1 Tax=Dacryopinax primogenitus (strain DJM 731) TaxID=1858805 RepID=M5FZ22_DACPD|nr:aldolase [Dacryopinax primogenitus]EJU01754.1 aldolase [Dacryopinax primogenitus]
MTAVPTPGYGFTAVPLDLAAPSHDLFPHHSPSTAHQLIATAHALVHPRGRGIYATDETPDGIHARLAASAAPGQLKTFTDEEQTARRKAWRETLYSSLNPQHISGVILYAETLLQFQLAPVLIQRGIIPGVRADTDGYPLPGSPHGSGEVGTQGLDDLYDRCVAWREAGARFTKWRAPFLVNEAGTLPSPAAIEAQAGALARFASISQSAGLVPIVEPDLDFSGDASIQTSVDAHVKVISAIYAKLAIYGVLLEGTLLKPSFPQPGAKFAGPKPTPATIAAATVTVLARTVPPAVGGIVFLSGGLSDSDSTLYLDAVNKIVSAGPAKEPVAATAAEALANSKDVEAAVLRTMASRLPPLTFSFGRGLQGDAMIKWVAGDKEGAQQAFAKRAEECSKAATGTLH